MRPFSPSLRRSFIRSVGAAVPEKCVTNFDLEQRLNTSHDWIFQRTGIIERRIASEGETTAQLATGAARRALEAADLEASAIDLIILATSTPDDTFPASATKVQAALGMTGGSSFAFDLQAVCSGFLFALVTADQFLQTGAAQRALVIGADTLSRLVDWTDRSTCVLFGDGAGAVVLEASPATTPFDPRADRGLLIARLHSDGQHRAKLYTDGGPSTTQTVGQLRMMGRDVFRFAVGVNDQIEASLFAPLGLSVADVDWFIPHQANERIIDASAEKLGIPSEKSVKTVCFYGNSSAASIPLALAYAVETDRLKPGHLILTESLGAGLTWGGALIRW